jgi:hypothetical protein
MTGKEKFTEFLRNIKKLSPERQKFWLATVKIIREKYEPLIRPPGELGDWLLDTANWLDKAYEYVGSSVNRVGDSVSEAQLGFVNELDKVYTVVADEVAKVPKKTGQALTDLTGTEYWPYFLGLGLGLGAYFYLTQVSPLKKFL